MPHDTTKQTLAVTPIQKEEGLFGAINHVVESAGLFLVDRPWVFFLFVIVSLPAEIVFAAFGGWSFLFRLGQPEPTDPVQLEHLRASNMMIDGAFGAVVPLATLLLAAALLIYGVVEESKQRAKEHEAFLLQLKNTASSERQEDIASLATQIDAVLPGWAAAASDPEIRQQLRAITTALQLALDGTRHEQRAVVRTLLRGASRRFVGLIHDLETSGSFMDPNERRELTNDLFETTKSYHVFFVGIQPIRSGNWRWHIDYCEFLEKAIKQRKDRVSWTFIIEDAVDPGELDKAVKDVWSFGIPCFVVHKEKLVAPREKFDVLFARGPLIEVFGADLPVDAGQELDPTAHLTWKSTALRVRKGRDHRAWVPQTDQQHISDEGIWASDNIDKLIRAGIARHGTEEFEVIKLLCARRERHA